MYISSDTNIWIDFQEVDHLDHPFRLEYQYYISKNAYTDELLKSDELREELLNKGLRLAEVTEDEYSQAMAYEKTYPSVCRIPLNPSRKLVAQAPFRLISYWKRRI